MRGARGKGDLLPEPGLIGDAAVLPGPLLAGVSSPCTTVLLVAKGSIRGTNGLEGLCGIVCVGLGCIVDVDICSGSSTMGVAGTTFRQYMLDEASRVPHLCCRRDPPADASAPRHRTSSILYSV